MDDFIVALFRLIGTVLLFLMGALLLAGLAAPEQMSNDIGNAILSLFK